MYVLSPKVRSFLSIFIVVIIYTGYLGNFTAICLSFVINLEDIIFVIDHKPVSDILRNLFTLVFRYGNTFDLFNL